MNKYILQYDAQSDKTRIYICGFIHARYLISHFYHLPPPGHLWLQRDNEKTFQ